MAKLTLEQLNKTAKELDNLMGLTPAPPEDGEKEGLTAWIKEAAEELQPADKVKTESRTVLEALGVWINPEDRVEPEDEDETPAQITITKEIDEAEGLKGLKELVKTYDEFKSLRGSITKYKAGDEEDLKEVLFDLLDTTPKETEPKKEEKPETKVIKMTPSGKDEVPIPKKGSQKASAKKKEEKSVSKEKKRTKKVVVEEMIAKKNGSTIEEIAQVITDEGIDPDHDKNLKVVKLWLSKMGFDTKQAAVAKNPKFMRSE